MHYCTDALKTHYICAVGVTQASSDDAWNKKEMSICTLDQSVWAISIFKIYALHPIFKVSILENLTMIQWHNPTFFGNSIFSICSQQLLIIFNLQAA